MTGPTSVLASAGSRTCSASTAAASAVAELRVDGVGHDHPAGGRALLARVAHRRVGDRGGGPVQVGVGQHDRRVLAAHLGLHPAAALRPPERLMSRPTSDEPVKETAATPGWSISGPAVVGAAEHDLEHIARQERPEDLAQRSAVAAAALDGFRIVALP